MVEFLRKFDSHGIKNIRVNPILTINLPIYSYLIL